MPDVIHDSFVFPFIQDMLNTPMRKMPDTTYRHMQLICPTTVKQQFLYGRDYPPPSRNTPK